MSISDEIIQLQSIDDELRLLRQQIKKLNNAKNTCQTRIIDYLRENNHPGINYKGTKIMLETKKKYKKRCPTKGYQFLESIGIQDSKHIFNQMEESMKGSPSDLHFIKIYK